ncbi:hypothetical protein E1091_18550 [Micromonospora fluostatini]|uniref:Uncharacterized protein n=2 Tax=Micromonospora TaxID=1873 RepID=A0ABY2DCB9_9ACTN|nr:hypothetical protein E1091_18550 [Micromonospora fluostatini]
MEDLRQQMQAETTPFRLRAMPKPRWRAFVGEHPPRKDDEGGIDDRDRVVGVNTETFYTALIRESVVDPALDEEDWAYLLGGEVQDEQGKTLAVEARLTSRQFDDLADAAWGLNRRDIDVPFSPAASRMTRGSGTE